MELNKITIGKNPPEEVNVVIEVPMHADPVKYEMDKDSGALFVDRFISTPMYYPCNYGFIPHTLSEDGDPCDVLVACDYAIVSGAVVPVNPIGVLLMEDEKGKDEKIIAIPAFGMGSLYEGAKSTEDLPERLIKKITHFFTHYKDLEGDKWVKITGFEGHLMAKQLIQEAIDRASSV